jgi:hypothetical protein
VVISNENAECTLEILRVQNPVGKRIVRREYSLNVSQAHGLVLAWVSLTNDGRYLVARDSAQFCLFELFDDQAKVVYSRSDRGTVESSQWRSVARRSHSIGLARALRGKLTWSLAK